MSTEGVQARRELADMIVKARHAARTSDGGRMTQQRLAKAVGYSQGNIQKYEAGTLRIPPDLIDSFIAVLGIGEEEADQMHKLAARNAVGHPWTRELAAMPDYAEPYITDEQFATDILSWHELRIPGPLQSEHFMLELFTSNRDVDVAPYLRRRSERKKLFRRPDLRRYDCILAEAALRHFASSLGPRPVQDEIDYLLAINDPADPLDLPNKRVTVRLLPTDTTIVDLHGDFSILLLPEPKRCFVYVEHVVGATSFRSKSGLTKAQATWEELSRAALDREATCVALRQLRHDLASG